MKSFSVLLFSLILAVIGMLQGCEDDQGRPGLFFSNRLKTIDLGKGHYELWLGFDDNSDGVIEYVSLVKFDSVGTDGLDLYRNKQVVKPKKPGNPLDDAVTVMISVEIENDPDPAQPGSRMMSGTLDGNRQALLLYSGTEGIGYDFSDPGVFSASFVIATPSDDDSTNETSGIWFADAPLDQNPGSGLHLPVLPEGWIYETWIAPQSETVCISMGKFLDPDSLDENGAGPRGGGNLPAGIQFPGEDFVQIGVPHPSIDDRPVPAALLQQYLDTFTGELVFNQNVINPLTGASEAWDVVVSIEPDPDNDPFNPFTIFPLFQRIQQNTPTGTVLEAPYYALGVSASAFVRLNRLF